MKRVLLGLVVVAAFAGAAWYVFHMTARPEAGTAEADRERNDFEAERVVLQQFDAAGRLQYEIEADRIVQLRNAGGIIATGLTFRHDPPDSEPGGPRRWVLTADEATMPAEGGRVTLSGNVQAQGLPSNSDVPVKLASDRLDYDIDQQLVSTDGEVTGSWGKHRFSGRSLRVDIARGALQLESDIHGTLSP